MGDIVSIGIGITRYTVAAVDNDKQTADITTVGSRPIAHLGIPWYQLRHIDESENDLWVVKEATED